MPKRRTWTDEDLKEAVEKSTSYRQVLVKIKLKPTGGNYTQLNKYIGELKLSTKHFKGHAWNKGLKGQGIYRVPLETILRKNSYFQSHKLKKRLFNSELKKPKCEICGWAKKAQDGRTPLELDHINGNRRDNRLENLRILCPNCHSLQPTHRGKNRGVNISAGAGTGRQS